jgi:ribulose-phosphate 3-epimerase
VSDPRSDPQTVTPPTPVMLDIVPSILSANFLELGRQVRDALDEQVSRLHVDVMDGHFVPNLSMGPHVVECLKPLADERGVALDVHLMVTDPDRHIESFVRAGASIVTVQLETHAHLERLTGRVRDLGAAVGVAINPATPLVMLEEIVSQLDQVLILTVSPGFAGQRFLPWTVDKIVRLRRLLQERGLEHVGIEVDGGLHRDTIGSVVRAGADHAVVGSGVFDGPAGVAENLRRLRDAVREAGNGSA